MRKGNSLVEVSHTTLDMINEIKCLVQEENTELNITTPYVLNQVVKSYLNNYKRHQK